MIKKIRHKGLKQCYEKGRSAKLNAKWLGRIRLILGALEAATVPDDMDLPGLKFHRLSGSLADYYSVRVTGNWRIIFRFEDGNATDVDLVDYH